MYWRKICRIFLLFHRSTFQNVLVFFSQICCHFQPCISRLRSLKEEGRYCGRISAVFMHTLKIFKDCKLLTTITAWILMVRHCAVRRRVSTNYNTISVTAPKMDTFMAAIIWGPKDRIYGIAIDAGHSHSTILLPGTVIQPCIHKNCCNKTPIIGPKLFCHVYPVSDNYDVRWQEGSRSQIASNSKSYTTHLNK